MAIPMSDIFERLSEREVALRYLQSITQQEETIDHLRAECRRWKSVCQRLEEELSRHEALDEREAALEKKQARILKTLDKLRKELTDD